MKRDNNLFVLRFKDSNAVFYFTKKSYVVHKLGTNGAVVDDLMRDKDYAERRGIYITLEDCSNIAYKYINNICTDLLVFVFCFCNIFYNTQSKRISDNCNNIH